jgi:hypothetical protein
MQISKDVIKMKNDITKQENKYRCLTTSQLELQLTAIKKCKIDAYERFERTGYIKLFEIFLTVEIAIDNLLEERKSAGATA